MKLTKVFRTDTDKDGNTLTTRDGRPYTRCNIQVQEHGDKWLSGFGNADNADWKEGDDVDIIVEEKQVGDKTYLNYKTKKKDGLGDIKIELAKMETRLNLKLDRIMDLIQPKKVSDTDIDYPTPEDEGIDVEDIPL